MSNEMIAYLKLTHGTFNTIVVVLFICQGILGLRIRRSKARPPDVIRRHRRLGPVAALLGISGFIAGMTVVFLHTGTVFKYPAHFLNGLAIVCLIAVTYAISRKIKGPAPEWRNRHFAVGILIICLYLFQVILGLGMLL